jgi:hypothetical protein
MKEQLRIVREINSRILGKKWGGVRETQVKYEPSYGLACYSDKIECKSCGEEIP